MRIICVGTDKSLNYFLLNSQVICEFWDAEQMQNEFRRNRNLRCCNDVIIIVDYDLNPELIYSKPPANWKIVGISAKKTKKDIKYVHTIYNPLSSPFNLITMLSWIKNETAYVRIGNFPLFLCLIRYEINTPHGIMKIDKRSWRILDYLNRNRGRCIDTDEMCRNIFDYGDKENVNITRLLSVYLTRLRKKFYALINNPVISLDSRRLCFTDFCGDINFEMLINRSTNNQFVVLSSEVRERAVSFFKFLNLEIAKASIMELRTNKKLNSLSRRYRFLTKNLILKDDEDFSLAKLLNLIKSIRFYSKSKIVHVKAEKLCINAD